MQTVPKYLQDITIGLLKKDPKFVNISNTVPFGQPKKEGLLHIPFEQFQEISTIRSLMVKDHKIEHLSPHIGSLKDLEYLDLSDNPLQTIPKEIGQLTELKFLRISDTINVSLGPMFESLETPGNDLEFLSDAGLAYLPDSFANCKQLEYLRLDSNRFEEFPLSICQLENLSYLDLSFNQLKSIPSEIGNLKELTYLKLSKNNFTSLPESIGQLKKLQRLRLDFLNLEHLPEGLGDLESLRMLEMCYCTIEAIPDSMKNLKYLKALYLMDTQISDIDLNFLKVMLPETRIFLGNPFGNDEE